MTKHISLQDFRKLYKLFNECQQFNYHFYSTKDKDIQKALKQIRKAADVLYKLYNDSEIIC
jgi:hypothetical protein